MSVTAVRAPINRHQTSHGSSGGQEAVDNSSNLEVVGELTGKLFRGSNKSWTQVGANVQMKVFQQKKQPSLTYFLKVYSTKMEEHLYQCLNTSLRVRLKDDLVQWQLQVNEYTQPDLHSFRCQTPALAQQLENLLKDIRHNLEVDMKNLHTKPVSEEVVVKAHLPDNQSTKVVVPGGITVHGLFILIAARRRLDPDCHEVRINHGKYKAAVKPTLTVSSLNIDEVYIVKIPRRTYAEGTSRILTVKLPSGLETYIQIKEQRKLRDLYSYICEKKGLPTDVYRLKFSSKIEGERDIDKTISQLDVWMVELEEIKVSSKQSNMESSKHTNGVEETDSGVTQKQEKKPKRSAPPPPKKVNPAQKGIPLAGMAGKRLEPKSTSPSDQESRESSLQPDQTHKDDQPTEATDGGASGKVLSKAASISEGDTLTKGKPKRHAPPPPRSNRKQLSADAIKFPGSGSMENLRASSASSNPNTKPPHTNDEKDVTLTIESRMNPSTSFEKDSSPAPFFDSMDDVDAYFNSIIAEADQHLKSFPDEDSYANVNSRLLRQEQLPETRGNHDSSPSHVPLVLPTAKPRSSPITARKAKSPKPTPRRVIKPKCEDTSPKLGSHSSSFRSTTSSSDTSPRSQRLNSIVQAEDGRKLLLVYPSPGKSKDSPKVPLKFEIPPPPPNSAASSKKTQNIEDDHSKKLDNEDSSKDDSIDYQPEDQNSSDEADTSTHHILGLSPRTSYEVHQESEVLPDGLLGPEENIENGTILAEEPARLGNIALNELVTTSFSEDTHAVDLDLPQQPGTEGEPHQDSSNVSPETCKKVNDSPKGNNSPNEKSEPPPLVSPDASRQDSQGYFLPPPDEFEAPKPPLPSCSPPESDEDSPKIAATTNRENVPLRRTEKSSSEEAKDNRVSVHGSLINVISNLQDLLSTNEAETIAEAIAENQGEGKIQKGGTQSQDAPEIESVKDGGQNTNLISVPPPIPTEPPANPPPINLPSLSKVFTPTKVKNSPPPPVSKKPIRSDHGSPKVQRSFVKKTSEEDGEMELIEKLKRRQEKIKTTEVEAEMRAKQGPAPPSQQPTSSPAVNPTVPIQPQNMTPQVAAAQVPQGMMSLPNQDPQTMIAQQQMLQQQVLQLQQQLQLLQQYQAIGSAPMPNPVETATFPVAMAPMYSSGQVPLQVPSATVPQPQMAGSSLQSVESIQKQQLMQQPVMVQPQMVDRVGQFHSPMTETPPPPDVPSQDPPVPSRSVSESSRLRSDRMQDVEDDFNRVMAEVKDTNPMNILKKVHDPIAMLKQDNPNRRSCEMEQVLYTAMKDRRGQLETSRLSAQDDEDANLSWS